MIQKNINSSIKKCEACGGNMIFSPQFQCLLCEKCGNRKQINFVRSFSKHKYLSDTQEKDFENSSKNKAFKCSNCGANVPLLTGDMANICPYCASPFVVEDSEVAGLKPDFIVPFAFDKNRASELFKSAIKRKFFLPNGFKKAPPIDIIEGKYFPVFSFDAHTQSSYYGVLEVDEKTDDSTTVTRTFNISGRKTLDHKDILTETSNSLDETIFNQILPYDVNCAFKFDEDFIRGYAVEQYTDPLDKCKNQADAIMDDIITDHILSKYSYDRVKYLDVSTERTDVEFAYGILPAYKFNYQYKGKNYENLINGQTGKVGGKLPKSKVKITFFILSIVCVLAGILLLVLLNK